jgi:hypothetical protein
VFQPILAPLKRRNMGSITVTKRLALHRMGKDTNQIITRHVYHVPIAGHHRQQSRHRKPRRPHDPRDLTIPFRRCSDIAGADKFTNLLTQWEVYLNPLALSIVPVTAATFMHIVGVIEIVAGVLVFVKPRIGGFVVMGWLLAIALQLIIWGRFLDVAVRDIVIALSGPLVLARLTPLVERVSVVRERETEV